MISITIIAPIIKSRNSDFALGFFSSKKYVLLAPRVEISTPPMIIPGIRGVIDILGGKKEKKGDVLTRTHLIETLKVHLKFFGLLLV